MAPVNPPIQPQEPKDYLRYSQDIRPGEDIKPRGQEQAQIKPTGVTQADESGKYAYAGAGNLIEGGAKLLDFVGKGIDETIKSDISEKAFSAANEIRTTYGDNLKILKSTGVSRAVGSLLSEDETAGGEVPEEIAEGIAQAGTLKGANAAGKISNTYYLAQLESKVVKPLRDRYPGYREYIDKQVAQITGLHPANDWIRSMVRDINAAGAANNRQSNRDESFMDKHNDIPEMPLWRKEYRENGGNSDLLRYRVNRHQAVKNQIETDIARWNHDKEYRGYLKGQATDTAHLDAASIVQTNLETFEIKALGPGVTPAKLADTFRKISSGELPLPDPDTRLRLKMGMDEVIRITKDQFRASNNKIRGKTPSGSEYSYSSILGDEATKIGEMHVQSLQRISDAIAVGNYKMVDYEMHAVKGRIDSAKLRALNDKGIGEHVEKTAALEQLSPVLRDLALKHFTDSKDTMKGVDDYYKNKIEKPIIDSVTKPDPMTGRTPVTMKDGIAAAAAAGITESNVGKKVTAESYRRITSWVDKISDTSIDINERAKIAIWAFSPGNHGIVGMFGKDGLDLFRGLASPGIADEIKKMPPNIREMYTTTMENAFGLDIMRNELRVIENYANQPGVTITWDGKNLGARYKYVPGGLTSQDTKRIDATISKLNQGLTGMHEVYHGVDGLDTEEKLMKLIQLYGFDPSKIPGEGFPQKIIDSLIKYRTGAEEEEKKRSKKFGTR